MNYLRKELKKRVDQSDFSMKGLSKAVGHGETLVRDIITGRTKTPSVHVMTLLAEKLQCTLQDLYGADYEKLVEQPKENNANDNAGAIAITPLNQPTTYVPVSGSVPPHLHTAPPLSSEYSSNIKQLYNINPFQPVQPAVTQTPVITPNHIAAPTPEASYYPPITQATIKQPLDVPVGISPSAHSSIASTHIAPEKPKSLAEEIRIEAKPLPQVETKQEPSYPLPVLVQKPNTFIRISPVIGFFCVIGGVYLVSIGYTPARGAGIYQGVSYPSMGAVFDPIRTSLGFGLLFAAYALTHGRTRRW